ncbi:hypothetical protein DFP94_101516 [Fontibacillus phaseoli]|uniref:Uncharacterized protein n=1 Tax=Fontibacillus phaseoli TaxID=1416533 RepID=A0A369BR39_9BACL|nr:hypothetical protein [Fontibacillus phaseoli]RCX22927.1 hypothetical protein DFP94_101516 [Fontibacillus phaseoli]
MNIYDEWRKGFEAGYYYGRLDEMKGAAYDSRTPGEKHRAKQAEEGADGCEPRSETT